MRFPLLNVSRSPFAISLSLLSKYSPHFTEAKAACPSPLLAPGSSLFCLIDVTVMLHKPYEQKKKKSHLISTSSLSYTFKAQCFPHANVA